ncbi:MAG: phosphatidate cytidylyltransferase [Dehalococcoidia bacterium]
MATRIASALVGIPVLVAAIWAGFPWLTALIALIALLGLREFYHLTVPDSPLAIFVFGSLWTLALVAAAQVEERWLLATLAGGILVGGMVALTLRHRDTTPLSRLAVLLGPLYVGFLLSLALPLRELEQGWQWLTFALLTAFATDSGAFFTGRAVGRRALAPSISPQKTQEGALGGVLWGVGAALLLGWVLGLQAAAWQQALLGAAIGVVAQFGDLAESSLKRWAGVKEAGGLIPGHGGLLDRLDSVVFTLPLMYAVITLSQR